MKILFPSTARMHRARQQLLLKELAKWADVRIVDMEAVGGDMASRSVKYAEVFDNYIRKNKPDLALIRGDRYEQLPLAMICAYHEIPIAHLEAGDLSGVIDNRVRGAITSLADLHFATNSDSWARLITRGTNPETTHNCGSLDVEYARSVQQAPGEKIILILYHALPGEDYLHLDEICAFQGYKVTGVKGNADYKNDPKGEEFKPSEFIKLLSSVACLVGNSSAGLKEASILGTPVVNIGSRQQNRLKPHNVRDCAYDIDEIKDAVQHQLKHGAYEPSLIYYKPNTSKLISERIRGYLQNK